MPRPARERERGGELERRRAPAPRSVAQGPPPRDARGRREATVALTEPRAERPVALRAGAQQADPGALRA